MKGYLPHGIVKSVVFWLLAVCIAGSTIGGILLSWGLIAEATSQRILWTGTILGMGSAGFLLLNSLFGSLGGEIFANRPTPAHPTVDPAFADRLKKAKEFREEHGGSKVG